MEEEMKFTCKTGNCEENKNMCCYVCEKKDFCKTVCVFYTEGETIEEMSCDPCLYLKEEKE
jgi:hypothetical protein